MMKANVIHATIMDMITAGWVLLASVKNMVFPSFSGRSQNQFIRVAVRQLQKFCAV